VITKPVSPTRCPFYVGQVPEVARKPMKTCQLPVLGKEYLPAQTAAGEEEYRITGAVYDERPDRRGGNESVSFFRRARPASGHLRQGTGSCALVADGVPGWFQAVLRLRDGQRQEGPTTTISGSTPTR